jgi:hypothetical protein
MLPEAYANTTKANTILGWTLIDFRGSIGKRLEVEQKLKGLSPTVLFLLSPLSFLLLSFILAAPSFILLLILDLVEIDGSVSA